MGCNYTIVCQHFKLLVNGPVRDRAIELNGTGLSFESEFCNADYNETTTTVLPTTEPTTATTTQPTTTEPTTTEPTTTTTTTSTTESPLANLTASEREDLIGTLFMSVSESTRIKIGHSSSDVINMYNVPIRGMIKVCKFLGRDCISGDEWSNFNDPKFGNCFTFNAVSAAEGASPKVVTLTGSAGGLDLELFLNQQFYMPDSLSEVAGAKITIHDPREFPSADAYGLNVQPSTAVSMAVQKVCKFSLKRFLLIRILI